MKPARLITPITHLIRNEDGMVTHLALVVMIIVLLFSGMSLDTSNARRTRTMLQTATDAAARAAIADLPSRSTALETALTMANANLLGENINSAVTSDSVIFGHWDVDSETFTASNSNPNAVEVIATRSTASSNPLPTFLLRLAGFQSWNIQVKTIAYRAQTSCETADIQSNGEISFTSNNDFYNSYCLASQSISFNNSNYFDDNNRILVPSLNDVDFNGHNSLSSSVGRGTANSSYGLTYGDIIEEKSGLSAAYTADVAALAANYLDPLYSGQPSYINTSASVISITAKDAKYTSFIPGRIYHITCGGKDGSKAQLYSDITVSEVVIVSECQLQLGTSSVFEDVVMVSLDTGNKAVYTASKVQLGADDDCAATGGVEIYSAGDFDSAADLETYGATISAVGSVHIAGKANGSAGLKVYANGDVSFAAQASLGTCSDVNVSFLAVDYSLVQ